MPFNLDRPPPLHPAAPVKVREPLKFPSFPREVLMVAALPPIPGKEAEDTVKVPISIPFLRCRPMYHRVALAKNHAFAHACFSTVLQVLSSA
jgi:hypothetical protein